ncbi:MAG: ATP-binding cassette domain-containing protein [Candidatus Methanoliparum thermophilum]|uniref:ATP-binding cassette domain-containing protein n=1 Tax=Methanoliparum thermophilum TaxID=2491083 RepID=A0A520KTF8_METT2|nr:MAG: ATP-binding cassette domain-containing protein [Candidatus Methanoliparum thermophilum]
MYAISTKDLTKKFKNTLAVDHINLDVEEGDIFGFVGLNGAGKTTFILMLSTLLNPTSGTAKVCGYDIIKNKKDVRSSIGLVFEEQAVDIYLTGRQNLDFTARMYNLPKKERIERISRVLESVGLSDRADDKVKDYSGGMLRRLEIARGMLIYPRVLLLDEPTIGVDVQTRRYLWDYLKKVNKEYCMTIFLTTSYMDEADYLCDRVAIIHEGRILSMGTPEKLKYELGENLIFLKVSNSFDEFSGILFKEPWVDRVDIFEDEEGNNWIRLSVKGANVRIPDIVKFAKEKGFSILSIKMQKPSLNDVVLHHIDKIG